MRFHLSGPICIPIRLEHRGGSFYFLRLFRGFLTHAGIPWTEDIRDEFDILFVNSWQVPYEVIHAAKRAQPAIRVVQRVDGSAQDYGRYDGADHKQARVNLLADATIFQSRYSKISTQQKFKVIQQDGPVIYNPVDVETFRPEGEKLSLPGKIKVCNAAWSLNRKKGTWQIPHLAAENPDVTFVLCGRYPQVPNHLPNLHYLGHLSYQELARAMRACDVFLNLSENDPCPNVVLQALASGLPVLYKDSGGVPELVGDAGGIVRTDLSNFRAALERVMDCWNELAAEARRRAVERFAPGIVFPQYLEEMERAQRRPLPTKWDILHMRLQGYPVLENPLSGVRERVQHMGAGLLQTLHRRMQE